VQIPGPGSCGAGSDPDKKVGEGGAPPERAGETSGDQNHREQPTIRAVLKIILRPLSAAD
jgi:hypothetical protein